MPPEEKIQQLEKRIVELEAKAQFVLSDRYDFRKNIQMQDGRNIQLATGTGTKIGINEDGKLAFFGATPVVQQAAIGDTTVTGSAQDSDARTAVNAILARLRIYGLIDT